jgi:hypothetical protein
MIYYRSIEVIYFRLGAKAFRQTTILSTKFGPSVNFWRRTHFTQRLTVNITMHTVLTVVWCIVSLLDGQKVVAFSEKRPSEIIGISHMFILINSQIIPSLNPHKYLANSQVYDPRHKPFSPTLCRSRSIHSLILSLSLSCLCPTPFRSM